MNDKIVGFKRKSIREKKCKPICECQICGRPCQYKYYGVWSCEGCKHFFRRAVKRAELYKCVGPANHCGEIDEKYCRSCRLDKCLLVGMDFASIEGNMAQKTFMAYLERRRLNLLLTRRNTIQTLKQADDLVLFRHFITSMGPIERAFKRIWDSNRPLPEEFVKRHSGIRALLGDGDNLLGKADEFLLVNQCWNKAEYLAELDLWGPLCPSTVASMTKDWLLCVELVKTMPHFGQLQIDDQVILLRHIFAPLSLFIFAYYSHAICAKTLTRGNGLTMISSMELDKFKAEPMFRSIAEQNFCDFVERISDSGIGYEEFLLLIAIFVANSTVDNLTPSARDHLYNASVLYANSLQKFLQKKFGPLEGMQKFASAMGLMERVFKAKQMFDQFMLYYEVFYEKRDLSQLLPNSLKFCFSSTLE